MRGDDAKAKCPDINLVRVPLVRGKADLTRYVPCSVKWVFLLLDIKCSHWKKSKHSVLCDKTCFSYNFGSGNWLCYIFKDHAGQTLTISCIHWAIFLYFLHNCQFKFLSASFVIGSCRCYLWYGYGLMI